MPLERYQDCPQDRNRRDTDRRVKFLSPGTYLSREVGRPDAVHVAEADREVALNLSRLREQRIPAG